MQISLAVPMTLAADFFKSDSTIGKTSAIPENKEERIKDAQATHCYRRGKRRGES
jgi:hypothetical protein